MVTRKINVFPLTFCVSEMQSDFSWFLDEKLPIISVSCESCCVWVSWTCPNSWSCIMPRENMITFCTRSPLGQLFCLLSCCHFPSWRHFMIYLEIQASSGKKNTLKLDEALAILIGEWGAWLNDSWFTILQKQLMVHAWIWTISNKSFTHLINTFFQFKAWERTGQIEIGLIELKEEREPLSWAKFKSVNVWQKHRAQTSQDPKTKRLGWHQCLIKHKAKSPPKQTQVKTLNFNQLPPPQEYLITLRVGGLGKTKWSLEMLFPFRQNGIEKTNDQVSDLTCTPPLPNRTKPNRCDLHAWIWTISNKSFTHLINTFFQFKAWERTGQIEIGLIELKEEREPLSWAKFKSVNVWQKHRAQTSQDPKTKRLGWHQCLIKHKAKSPPKQTQVKTLNFNQLPRPEN